jgi:cell division protein FtsB
MDGLYYRKIRPGPGLLSLLRKLARNRRLIVVLVLGGLLAVYLAFGNRGVLQRVRLQAQKSELEARIKAAEQESLRLRTQSRALDSDRKAIEKVAREKYGMVREGETVYKVARRP